MGRPKGARPRSALTMTIADVCKLFRSYGIPAENLRMADDIASGIYPFGRVVKVSPTGRRTFEIWRVDVEAFLKTKMPEGYELPEEASGNEGKCLTILSSSNKNRR